MPLPRRGGNPDALRCLKNHVVRAEFETASGGAHSVADPAPRFGTAGRHRGRCTGAIPRNRTDRNIGPRDRTPNRSARVPDSVHRSTSASSRSPPPVAEACTTTGLRRCSAAGHRRLQNDEDRARLGHLQRGPGLALSQRTRRFIDRAGGDPIRPGTGGCETLRTTADQERGAAPP